MQDFQEVCPSIKKLRKDFQLPETISDSQIIKLVKFTREIAKAFFGNLEKKFDELTPKIHKQLRRLGFSQEEIDIYEDFRYKSTQGMTIQISSDNLKLIEEIMPKYYDIHNKLLAKIQNNYTGTI